MYYIVEWKIVHIHGTFFQIIAVSVKMKLLECFVFVTIDDDHHDSILIVFVTTIKINTQYLKK